MRLKTVIRNINILNMLLLTVMIIFSDYSITPMLETKVNYTLPVAKQRPGAGEKQEEDITLAHLPSVLEYALIGENNLFHPERKIPVEKKEEQPLPKPEFVLYGTLITNDISLAYIEDMKAPRSSPGRGRRQTALRKGETIAGFTLKEIEHEMIVMVRGEEKMTVPIDDPSHPKERKSIETKAAAPQPPQPRVSTPQPAAPREISRQRRPDEGRDEKAQTFKPADAQKLREAIKERSKEGKGK
ncbi:MAG: hypothetical protein FJ240_11330 [Nitrospira sp.]|nr:hypothetical protein [Nitrospira sp.]